MFENKEKLAKFFILILTMIFAGFLIFSFYLQKALFLPAVGFLGSVFVFLVLEMYLRIQHNIDSKYKKNKNTDSFKELVITLGQIEIDMKNNFEVRTEKLKKEIISEISLVVDNKINHVISEINHAIGEINCDVLEGQNKTNHAIGEINRYVLDNQEKTGKLFDKIFDQNIKDKELFIKTIDRQTEKIYRFYWTYITEKRKKTLIKMCPDIFNFKSVLYIGAKDSRSDFLEEFQKSGCEITILEIFKPNVEYLKGIPWIHEVIEGDVCKFFTDKKYDVIFWWHGPEHIKKEDINLTIKKLEFLSNNLIVLGCPWGNVPQLKTSDENPFEEHVSFFETGEFEKMGYETDYSGKKDTMGSNIVSIKRINR